MKNLNLLSSLLLLLAICVACNLNKRPNKQVVHVGEIEKFLNEESFKNSSGLANANSNIEFWRQKLVSNPKSMVYHAKLAGFYSKRFTILKNIDDLRRADSLYGRALQLPGGQNAGNLQVMAQLSITKHQFKQAQEYVLQALEEGSNRATSYMLLYDALMERGEYEWAKQNLDRLDNKKSFAYRIRLSKYKDYEGDLDSAIYYMEEAAHRIKHDLTLRAWSQSNLGDMYGHANRINDSYRSYLKVLQEEETGGSYLHSLKGIAWIAYAHDDNPELAGKILRFVDSQIESPEVKPMLAELADYMNHTKKKEQYIKAFVTEAKKPIYYGMYNTYLIEFAVTEMNNYEWAMQLVSEELENRPNPQIYNLEALAFLQQGDAEKALKIIEEKVKGYTYEPGPVLNMAKIYKANGMDKEAGKYFKEALKASYELGPLATVNIKKELAGL